VSRNAAIVLVLLALVMLGCATGKPRVILLGDSITMGLVSGPERPSFATLLEEAIGESVELRNVACGGLTVAMWLADARPAFCTGEVLQPNLFRVRLQPLLPAEVVVVLLGTNDSIGLGGEIEPGEYGRRMRLLTAQLVEHGARQVLLLAPPFINNDVKASVRLQGYGREIAAICAEGGGVSCGPDLFDLLPASDFGRNDLHPNGRGHARIAVAVEAALRSLIDLEASPQDN
jgi:lysophospholipase L1-like esterase